MKSICTIIFCALSLCSFSQNDSVSIGAGATDMAFYSLSGGLQATAPNNDWHIAFSARKISGFSFSKTNQATAIRINEAYGLKLFRSPNQKLGQYAAFDTTGYESWQQMHNPDTTWTIGAFNININLSDEFNYGWGEYNQGDHNIYSDSSIYLLQLPDGTFKKFVILNLLYDTAFNVQFANLDNSSPVTMQIDKNLYPTKSFVYVNLENDSIMDKEPALTAWDFMELRYNNTVYNPSNQGQDIGILTNDADNVYAASGSAAQQSCYNGTGFYNDINIIGKSWMAQPNDTVIPGLAYFVEAPGGTYKMTITGFGGTTTGTIDFTLSQCATSGISQVNDPAMAINVYPVPASDILNISISGTGESTTTVQLTDMTGRTIMAQTSEAAMGGNTLSINTAPLQSGNYVLTVSTGAEKVNRLVTIVR